MITTKANQQPDSTVSLPRGASEPVEEGASLGLAASLLKDRESILRWVDEAPLRLVAAVLIDKHRRRAQISDIKATLTAEVIDSKDWNRWWNIVRPGLRDSRHFHYAPREQIRLRAANPADVGSYSLNDLRAAASSASSRSTLTRANAGPTTRIAGLGGWILWAQADEDEPMPRSVPSSDFITFLERLPASVISTVVSRLSSGIEQRLIDSKQRPAENSVDMWQAALIAALRRWSELSYPPGVSIREIVTLTVRVLEELGSLEFEDVVAWFGDFTTRNADNIDSVCDALLDATVETSNGTGSLLTRMYHLLDADVRKALWKRLIDKGLMQSYRAPIDRWIAILAEEDRYVLLSELIATNSDDGAVKRINELLMKEWRIASSEQRYLLFDAMVLFWVLHWRSMLVSSAAMIEIASAASDEKEVENSLVSEWRSVIRHLSERDIARVREDSEQRIAELEARIGGNEAELDRVQKYVRFLEGENRSKRKAAELEISRDAIIVLGITLQELFASSVSKTQELVDAESNIVLALSTLGAGPFGAIGDVVPFNPLIHEASPTLARGTMVRIVSPGVNYSRHSDAPVTLLKARTEQE